MSRPSLTFLRPYLYQSPRALRAEHARAYLSVQRRFAQSIAADDYTGPHDVEKHKRLTQLKQAKPLGDYHPRLQHSTAAERLSIRDFNAKYEGIEETKADRVAVFGMIPLKSRLQRSDSIRKAPLGAVAQLQADVPGH
jgi:lysyl-tRNA synthetase, class II